MKPGWQVLANTEMAGPVVAFWTPSHKLGSRWRQLRTCQPSPAQPSVLLWSSPHLLPRLVLP